MAPEVLTGQAKVTPLVDVWAMGVILYGMLFGALPFLGTTSKDLI
jgi:MAP/microtubule affinity-regulating kinase